MLDVIKVDIIVLRRKFYLFSEIIFGKNTLFLPVKSLLALVWSTLLITTTSSTLSFWFEIIAMISPQPVIAMISPMIGLKSKISPTICLINYCASSDQLRLCILQSAVVIFASTAVHLT